jgi:hypothetical protein
MIVAVSLHSGETKIDQAAMLYEWKKTPAKILRIAPEIVVGIDADDGVEEFLRIWKIVASAWIGTI